MPQPIVPARNIASTELIWSMLRWQSVALRYWMKPSSEQPNTCSVGEPVTCAMNLARTNTLASHWSNPRSIGTFSSRPRTAKKVSRPPPGPGKHAAPNALASMSSVQHARVALMSSFTVPSHRADESGTPSRYVDSYSSHENHVAVGEMVGDVVGSTVGLAVGFDVGLAVGFAVGSEEVGDMVGNVVGDVVGSEVVGEIDGDMVGSEVVGEIDGEAVGSEAVGEIDGDVVGSEAVGEIDGDVVGSEVVGEIDGDVVGSVVGEAVGDVVGSEVVGEIDGDVVGSEVVGEMVGELVGEHVTPQHVPSHSLM